MCYTSNLGGPKAHNTIHINSPPQTQDGCETNLRLSTKVRKRLLGCDLVKIRGEARNFCLGGPICVANLLVYLNFHTHTQTYASIHIHRKLISFIINP